MRATSRFWAAVALGGVLTLFAVLLDRPAPLFGGAAIGVWLLAHQARFVERSRRTVDGLSVDQTSSRERVTKDEPFTVTLEATLPEPSLLDVEITGDPPVNVAGVDDDERRCRLQYGEQAAETTIQASGAVAGRARFGRPELRLTDPFGLFSESLAVGESVDVHVEAHPPRQLHVGGGGEQMAVGYGERDTVQLGTGQEPVELRKYTSGDELRHIDWKATARLGQPHVRKYERKTPRRTTLVVDHRASMGDGPPGGRKLDYARDAALLFLKDARAHEDPVSLFAVGDEGLTVERELGAGLEQYNRLRQHLFDLRPTADQDGDGTFDRSFETDTARARRLAEALDDGTTAFDRTLRPYVAERDAYVSRLDSRPLFSSVRAHRSEFRRATWTILVTDDSNRAELIDAVKLARRGEGHVAAFLTPTVLFEEVQDSDRETAYQRYRDFENFRRKLTNLDGVTAFEVGPGDRLEAILSVDRAGQRGAAAGMRHAGGVR